MIEDTSSGRPGIRVPPFGARVRVSSKEEEEEEIDISAFFFCCSALLICVWKRKCWEMGIRLYIMYVFVVRLTVEKGS